MQEEDLIYPVAVLIDELRNEGKILKIAQNQQKINFRCSKSSKFSKEPTDNCTCFGRRAH